MAVVLLSRIFQHHIWVFIWSSNDKKKIRGHNVYQSMLQLYTIRKGFSTFLQGQASFSMELQHSYFKWGLLDLGLTLLYRFFLVNARRRRWLQKERAESRGPRSHRPSDTVTVTLWDLPGDKTKVVTGMKHDVTHSQLKVAPDCSSHSFLAYWLQCYHWDKVICD